MNDQIQNLLDQAPPSRGAGKYLDQIDEGGREVLDEFEAWLKDVDEKSETTARAYKGYVAKAIVELEKDPEFELDTDVKSAINALRRFKMWSETPDPSDGDPAETAGDAAT